MPLRVAGAWIGGTIDTTAAVVVKFAQNALIGFIAASLVFSLLLTEGTATGITRITKDLRGIWFSLAFVGAQLFNIVWTLALAYILYSGGIFPAPAI